MELDDKAWIDVGGIKYPLEKIDRKSLFLLQNENPGLKGFPAYVYYELDGDYDVYPHPSDWLLDSHLFILDSKNNTCVQMSLRNFKHE